MLDSIAAVVTLIGIYSRIRILESELHGQVHEYAVKISEHLLPRTRAYQEIWLDEEKVVSNEEEGEPIYGSTYLPRKFKIALAIPPHNDVDLYANDLGFVALSVNRKLVGFNVFVGAVWEALMETRRLILKLLVAWDLYPLRMRSPYRKRW